MLDTLTNQLNDMGTEFVRLLPQIGIALIVIIITAVIAGFAVKIADAMIGKTSLRPSLRNLIETLVKLAVWILGLMIAAIIVFFLGRLFFG